MSGGIATGRAGVFGFLVSSPVRLLKNLPGFSAASDTASVEHGLLYLLPLPFADWYLKAGAERAWSLRQRPKPATRQRPQWPEG